MCRSFVVLLAVVVGCNDGAPHLVPSVMRVSEQHSLRVEGLAPEEFLTIAGDRVALVPDFRVELGTTTTTVVTVEPGGATVMTDAPLAIGTYALQVNANGRAWYVEDALAVIADTDGSDASADARVCPDAPSGCTSFSCPSTSSCYYVCEAERYATARASCSTKNLGCLATINDADENECIAAATLPVFPDLVWFGYQQAAAAVEPAGGWGWVCDGSSFVAPNWGQFEPNDEDGEDCGVMGDGGAWIDGDCSSSMRFVCELP